jgi:hypothetical protein
MRQAGDIFLNGKEIGFTRRTASEMESMRVYTTSRGLGNFQPALWGLLHRR